jgi:hypothetical protein
MQQENKALAGPVSAGERPTRRRVVSWCALLTAGSQAPPAKGRAEGGSLASTSSSLGPRPARRPEQASRRRWRGLLPHPGEAVAERSCVRPSVAVGQAGPRGRCAAPGEGVKPQSCLVWPEIGSMSRAATLLLSGGAARKRMRPPITIRLVVHGPRDDRRPQSHRASGVDRPAIGPVADGPDPAPQTPAHEVTSWFRRWAGANPCIEPHAHEASVILN